MDESVKNEGYGNPGGRPIAVLCDSTISIVCADDSEPETRRNSRKNYILLIGKAWLIFWFADPSADGDDFISRNSSISAILRWSHVDVGQLQFCGGNSSPS
jgi:hypothetical protein